MTDRRSGPPLFDLMRERGEDPDAHKPTPAPSQSHTPAQAPAPASAPRVEREPETSKQTAWDSSGGVSRAERSAAAMLDADVPDESGIRLSSPVFYTMVVLAIVLILSAWALGYKLGEKEGASKIEELVRDQPVVSPGNQPGSETADDLTQNPGTSDNQRAVSNTTTPAQRDPVDTGNQPSTRPGAGVMGSSGYLSDDPRVPGLNYLVLATLSTEQAADAISFMFSQGVDVIGVPVVDSGRSAANNPSLYTLYSLGVAIPGNQWSAMSVQRNQHQRLIADLGARWQRERRGASDFSESKTNWEKFE